MLSTLTVEWAKCTDKPERDCLHLPPNMVNPTNPLNEIENSDKLVRADHHHERQIGILLVVYKYNIYYLTEPLCSFYKLWSSCDGFQRHCIISQLGIGANKDTSCKMCRSDCPVFRTYKKHYRRLNKITHIKGRNRFTINTFFNLLDNTKTGFSKMC